MEHRREEALELQDQWPTALASQVRYASQVKEAVKMANILCGTSPTAELQWLQPIVCSLPLESVPEVDVDSDVDEGLKVVPEFEPELDPEQVLLGDILGGENEEDDEKEEVMPVVNVAWKLPEVNPSILACCIARSHVSAKNMKTDLLHIPSAMGIDPDTLIERLRPTTDGFPRLTFEVKDIEILSSNTALLNDTCINGCAALLYSEYLSPFANQITIFSTHDLPRVRYNTTDDVIWRNVKWSRYWEKSIWILPIHRPGHWVVCIIDVAARRLLLSDSFAEKRPWKKDVPVSMFLMHSNEL